MMVRKSLILVFAFILFVNLFVFASALNDLISLQGNVQDGGVNLASGDVVVSIYDAATGGTMVYNSTTDFTGAVVDGKYDILVGNGTNILSLEYGTTYYLELFINDEKFDFNGNDRQMFQSAVGNVTLLNIGGGEFIALTNNSVNWSDGLNITTGSGGWFKGLFNWTVSSVSSLWASFDGGVFTFNETNFNFSVNQSIDLRTAGGDYGDFNHSDFKTAFDANITGKNYTTGWIQLFNWTNVTITQSQITDFSGGDFSVYGDFNFTDFQGSFDSNVSGFLDDYVNISGATMTGRLVVPDLNVSGDLNVTGDVNFGGLWTDGGVTVSGGKIYAQVLYVYNITSLAVDTLNVNGSIIPQIGFDDTFDIGNSSLRWNDLHLAGNIWSNGTISGTDILGVDFSDFGDFNASDFKAAFDNNITLASFADFNHSDFTTAFDNNITLASFADFNHSNFKTAFDANISALSSINISNGTDVGFYANITRVGIGTATPQQTFTVVGTSNVTGASFFEGIASFLVGPISLDWSNVTITEAQVTDADWWDADGDVAADEISESKIAFSTACAAGNHYYLSGNDLACEADDDTTYTAGDALTLTGVDFDFDGGASPAGDLGGTWATPSVDDDSHNHVYSNLDAFTEANLYTILSDVTQFYESGDKVGDADTLDTINSLSFLRSDTSDDWNGLIQGRADDNLAVSDGYICVDNNGATAAACLGSADGSIYADDFICNGGNCLGAADIGADAITNSELGANSVDLTSDALSIAYAGSGLAGGGTAALYVDNGELTSDVFGTTSSSGTYEFEDGSMCIGNGGCTAATADGILFVAGGINSSGMINGSETVEKGYGILGTRRGTTSYGGYFYSVDYAIYSQGAAYVAGAFTATGTTSLGYTTVSDLRISNSGDSSCFAAGTKITMVGGEYKNIEDVQIGDKVISYDVDKREDTISIVTGIEEPVRDHICEVEVGETLLEMTYDHPLYTTEGWQTIIVTEGELEVPDLKGQLTELKLGSRVLGANGEYEEVKSINCRSELIRVYNLLSVEESHSFYANGFVAHNGPASCSDLCVNAEGGIYWAADCGGPPPEEPETPRLYSNDGNFIRKVGANLKELEGTSKFWLRNYTIDSSFIFTIENEDEEYEYFDEVVLNLRCYQDNEMFIKKKYYSKDELIKFRDGRYKFLAQNDSMIFSFDRPDKKDTEGCDFVTFELEISGYYEKIDQDG